MAKKKNNSATHQELFKAIREGDIETVKKLLEQGVDPNSKDENGFTGLHIVAREGKLEMAKLMLSYGADPNAEATWTLETPLHEATKVGDFDMVYLLLKSGSKPNMQNSRGETSLHIASEYCFIDIVKLLLKHGADPTIPDMHSNTPLDNIYECMTRLINTMLEKISQTRRDKYGITILHTSAMKCNSKLVEWIILNTDIGVNDKDVNGNTALHYAAINDEKPESECLETVKILIEYGADPMARNDNGKTPIDLAREAERFEIVKFLKKVTSTK